MTVLVVPEDFRKDQFLLKPLLVKLLASLGKPRATVRVCQDPLLGGVGEALKTERVAEIVARYGRRVQVILLCVDRDGDTGRRRRLDRLEEEFGDRLLGAEARRIDAIRRKCPDDFDVLARRLETIVHD